MTSGQQSTRRVTGAHTAEVRVPVRTHARPVARTTSRTGQRMTLDDQRAEVRMFRVDTNLTGGAETMLTVERKHGLLNS